MCRFFMGWVLINLLAVSYSDLQAQKNIPGQPLTGESESLRSLIAFTDSVYGSDIRLVNGRTYQPPHLGAAGHPYFLGQEWLDGSVIACGQQFNSLLLQYDILGDYLIYIDRSADGSVSRIQLNKEYISGFSISGHRFVTISREEVSELLNPHYFEALVIDKVSLLTRWEKKFEKSDVENFPYGRFSSVNKTICILKEGMLIKISNRSSVLKCLADKKPELIRFMKENNIKGLNLKDNELTEIVNYYNKII
jgi:hypothetical protein